MSWKRQRGASSSGRGGGGRLDAEALGDDLELAVLGDRGREFLQSLRNAPLDVRRKSSRSGHEILLT